MLASITPLLSRLSSPARKQSFKSFAAIAEDTNLALVFIKPHAIVPSFQKFVPEFLAGKKIDVLKSGIANAEDIRKGGIVDRHYNSISHAAMMESGQFVKMLADDAALQRSFEEGAGETADSALEAGRLLNLPDALSKLPYTPMELNLACQKVSFRVGPGVYCGTIDGYHIVNGFYGDLRDKFTRDGAKVNWFVVKFAESDLSWKSFRGEVIGATNPAKAVEGSIRSKVFHDWKEFGMSSAPDMQDNGVHASAGPLESMRERIIWLGADVTSEPLYTTGVSHLGETKAKKLLENAWVKFADGSEGQSFDVMEDVNTSEAIKMVQSAVHVS